MSAAHRSLVRLPLEIFTDLIRGRAHNATAADDPEALRRKICSKLKKFPTRSTARRVINGNGNGNYVIYESITTVGQLLTRISKLMLLKVLDPLLTYEEIDILLQRIACTCAPKPTSAYDLMNETDNIADLTSEVVSLTEQQQQQQPACSLIGGGGSNVHHYPFRRLRYLPTGLPSLDRCLKGGLRVGTITEIVGRAGAGKTQLAMQLCVMAARYQQGCIYIDTEKKLSLPRLHEIAEKRAEAFNRDHGRNQFSSSVADPLSNPHFSYDQQNSFASASTLTHQDNHMSLETSSSSASKIPYRRPNQVLDNVTILSPTTTQALLSALVEVEELILIRNQDAMDAHHLLLGEEHSGVGQESNLNRTQQQHSNNNVTFPVRLLIVDSIAAPTKRGHGCVSAAERAATVFQCAQRIKQLAHQLQLAVLVINQVFVEQLRGDDNNNRTSNHSHRNATNSHHSITEPSDNNKVAITAALGTSWHHCVSTRIMLEQPQPDNFDQSNHPTMHANGYHQNVDDHSLRNATYGPSRTATIVKSNVVGLQSTKYEVVGAGVVDNLP